MKAFLLGFTLVYAIGVAIVLMTDQAVRINNPWVLSFSLSGFVVPAACGWAGAEFSALVLRRKMLLPGRSHWVWRLLRGIIAALIGVCGAIGLVIAERPDIPDYVRTGACAFIASILVASIGRQKRRAWACGKCGYDLRGLTSAAAGRCPECGEVAAAPAVP